ncbi:hypothetical protein PYCC9005_003118 [Savitreella phatthalungensis]
MFRNIFPSAPVPRGKGPKHDGRNASAPENPRKPKTRPPRSLRDKILKSLPMPSGPYSVGSIDLEIPVERRDFGADHRVGPDVLVAETVLMTIFYPIAVGSGGAVAPDGRAHWSRMTWLSRDRASTARGYGDFGGVNKLFAQTFFLSTVGLTKLPAWRNAQLAMHYPRDTARSHEGAPIFPLILFSHGLGGTRTTYSSIVTEYASNGWVCVCVEHRDGSGPRTFVNYPRASHRPPRKVDYVEPYDRDGLNDTANEIATDRDLRDAQLAMRKYELECAYNVLCRINDGDGHTVAEENTRYKPSKKQSRTPTPTASRPDDRNRARVRRQSSLRSLGDAAGDVVDAIVGGTSRGTIGVDWGSWVGRLQIDNVAMVGHSFGGATAYSVCRTPGMLSYVTCGILLDTWGQGIAPNPLADEQLHPGVPLLVIGSESFLWWDENTRIMEAVSADAINAGQLCWTCTIRGSFHLSFSDFCPLWPHLSRILFSTKVDARRCIDLVTNLSMEFFKTIMPKEIARYIDLADEDAGLLSTQVSEAWKNVKGKRNAWRKKMQRAAKEAEREAKKAAADAGGGDGDNASPERGGDDGKGVEQIAGRSSEIWMHVSPFTKEESNLSADGCTPFQSDAHSDTQRAIKRNALPESLRRAHHQGTHAAGDSPVSVAAPV